MRRSRKSGDYLILLVFLALGAFVGDIVGELLAPHIPVLGRYGQLGFSPVSVNLLHLVEFTFGVSFRLNALGAIFAVILGLFLWWK